MTDDKPKRMIMIGGWTDIYRKARDCGFEVTLVQEKIKIHFEDLSYIKELITSSLDNPDLLDIFTVLHEKEPFDCVVSFQEMGVLTAAQLKEKLNIFGNPLFPVLTTRDKGKMRAFMQEKGFPSIPYSIVSNREEVQAFIRQVSLPVILKPSYGTGSAQIYKITDTGQIEQAIEQIKSAYHTDVVLVEQFIEGTEVSVEGFTWNGKHTMIAVTDKLTTGAPHFVETGHNMPSSLSPDVIEGAKRMAAGLLELIGHKYGPSHTEIIVTGQGMYVVETHTRVGGDFIFDMVDRVFGFDLFTQTFNGFAGKEPIVESKFTGNAAAIRYLQLSQGVVSHLEGIEEAKRVPGILKCQIDVEPGQNTKNFTKSIERNGYILAEGSSVEDAARNIQEAWDCIRIEVS